jgi:hypothetical protein
MHEGGGLMMLQEMLGVWARGLDDDDLSQAILALGRLWILADAPGRWRPIDDYITSDVEISTERAIHSAPFEALDWLIAAPSLVMPARQCRDYWGRLLDSPEREHREIPLRLEITPGRSKDRWNEGLPRSGQPGAEALALVAAFSRLKLPVQVRFPITSQSRLFGAGYHWPLRVSVIPEDWPPGAPVDYRALLDELEPLRYDWGGRLVEFHSGLPSEEPVDLLLVRARQMSQLLQVLRDMRGPVATLLFIFSDERTEPSALRELLAWAGHDHFVPPVVAVIELSREMRYRRRENLAPSAAWLREFLRELTHNQPIDIALYHACRAEGIQAALAMLLADPQFLATSRLADVTRHLLEEHLRDWSHWIQLPSYLSQQFRLPERPMPVSFLYSRFRRQMDNPEFWISEVAGATGMVHLLQELRLRPPAPREILESDRWIQAHVYEAPDESRYYRRGVRSGFRAQTQHVVEVWVGPEEPGGIRADIGFPDDELPWDEGNQPLTVVFTEPRFAPKPQVREITLPALGNSTRCEFTLDLREDTGEGPAEEIEGRVIVLHRNRVLQTALLRGPIVAEPDAQTVNITLRIETAVRPGVRHLEQRQPFDLAVVINRTLYGKPTATSISGSQAVLVSLDGIQQQVRKIAKRLARLMRREAAITPADETMYKLLRYLVIQGGQFYQSLVSDAELGPLFQKKDPRYVQIVAAKPEAFLPVELFYSGPEARRDATCCPRGLQALSEESTFSCPEDCPTAGPSATVFCPLRLWCLSRVIERHLRQPQPAEPLDNQEFLLQLDPSPNRDRLPLLRSALLAASERVHQQCRPSLDTLIQTLRQETQQKTYMVNSWPDWPAAVAANRPSLLVLLPHTDEDAEYEVMTLEIGNTNLAVNELQEAYVRAGEMDCPVVLLLGCTTGDSDTPYKHFVAQFRRKRAAIVLSTLSVVLGRHAAPVAAELVRRLAKLCRTGKDVRFGEALLEVRRSMLAQGILMVLGLVAYGDADWWVTAE